MCIEPLQAGALIVRVTTCAALLSLLPNRVVPVSVRLGFALALSFLFLPMLSSGGSACPNVVLMFVSAKGFSLSWEVLFHEIAAGTSIALVVGTIGYVAFLLADWLGAVVTYQSIDEHETIDRNARSLFRFFLLLLLVTVIFSHSNAGAVYMLQAFQTGLVHWPVAESGWTTAQGAAVLKDVVVMAFKFGFALAVPVFAVALMVDLLFLLLNRYVQRIASSPLLLSVKLPLIVLLVSICLYPLSDRLATTYQQSVDQSSVEEMIGGTHGG